MSFEGAAVFEHQLGDGTLRLELELGDIEASGEGLGVDGLDVISQLGPAELLQAADFEVAAGETLVIDVDHPDHDALAAAMADWLVVAEDTDGDGFVGDGDTVALATPGAESSGEDEDDEEDEEEDDEEEEDGED